MAPKFFCTTVYRIGKFLEKRYSGAIEDRVHSIQTQRINVKILDPLQCVLYEKLAHSPTVGPIEIQRRAPGSPICIGKVRRELGEVIALGSKVIVDHVEYNSDANAVTLIDELLKVARSTV